MLDEKKLIYSSNLRTFYSSKNIIEFNDKHSTFEKLKNLQKLIKKESALKEICKKIIRNINI